MVDWVKPLSLLVRHKIFFKLVKIIYVKATQIHVLFGDSSRIGLNDQEAAILVPNDLVLLVDLESFDLFILLDWPS